MLETLERPTLSLQQVISFIGNGLPKLVERALDATGGSDPTLHRTGLEQFRRFYSAAPADLTRPYPGAMEMLERLRAAETPLGVCTNKPQDFTETILDQMGLSAFFGSVVGGDRLPVRKPDPAPLALCFEELGAVPQAGLYVGDSETDEATAAALNVPFALFTGGYRKKEASAFRAAFRFETYAEFEAHARSGASGA